VNYIQDVVRDQGLGGSGVLNHHFHAHAPSAGHAFWAAGIQKKRISPRGAQRWKEDVKSFPLHRKWSKLAMVVTGYAVGRELRVMVMQSARTTGMPLKVWQ
jgi:hypothetical protein